MRGGANPAGGGDGLEPARRAGRAVRFSSPTAEIDLIRGRTRGWNRTIRRDLRWIAGSPSWSGPLEHGARQGAGRADQRRPRGGAIRPGRIWMRPANGSRPTIYGAVWQPKVTEGWAPFQNGRWRWYDALGYTWVSDDAWGWLPYHYGRWTRTQRTGLDLGAAQ